MDTSTGKQAPSNTRAFTLIELVVAMAISTILMAGIASTLMIATAALPDANHPLTQTLEGSSAVARIATDLYGAETFTERSPTAVTFTVADRTNDDPPVVDTIRYAWSGVGGDPLTRQFNGGAVVNIHQTVEDFQLEYILDSVTIGSVGPVVENPAAVLVDVGADGGSGEMEYTVSTDTWCGQYFSPDPGSMPADAVSWRVDRIYFQLKKVGSPGGVTAAQLWEADDDGLPTGFVYDELLIDEGLLSGQNWTSVSFTITNSPTLAPAEGVCLVLKPFSGTNTCLVLYQTTVIAAGNVRFLSSSDAGVTFTSVDTEALTSFQVHGIVSTRSGATTTIDYVTGARIKLRSGVDASTEVHTQTQILNAP